MLVSQGFNAEGQDVPLVIKSAQTLFVNMYSFQEMIFGTEIMEVGMSNCFVLEV